MSFLKYSILFVCKNCQPSFKRVLWNPICRSASPSVCQSLCPSVGRFVGQSLYISLFLYISVSVNVNANVDKDITHTVHLQSNTTSLELWIIFYVTFLFLLVWCKQKIDKKVKKNFLFLKCIILFLKNKYPSDFFIEVRMCTRSEFCASEFMNICDNFQFSVTRMSSTFYSASKLEYRKLNSYFHSLILLSGDRSLNPRPNHQHKLQWLNELNIFKSIGLHFIHLNINSLLRKNEELGIIA